MTAPSDPDETHGNEPQENEPREELLDANSMTWGTVDPDFDEMFRERLGPLPVMPTPPYAFERVLVTGRRRRARKVWAGTAAAALVVLAGTAGTTVALHGNSPSGPTIGPANASTNSGPTLQVSPSPSVTHPAVVAPPSPSASSASPSQAASTNTPSASTATSTPQCSSTSFTLSVSTEGTDELLIVLTNTSGHSCTTKGYPGLELVTQGGLLQSTTVTRMDKSSVQTLTVTAGESISTTATYTALASGASPGPDCRAPSSSLALIPPNEQLQIVQPITGGPVTACGNGNLDTTPLVPGSSG
jgi:hypothetical protein